MPGAARNNVDDVNGGLQRHGPQSTVYVEGKLWCVIGWKGDSHPPCPDPSIHCSDQWTMIEGSPNVYVESIKVCRAGDKADCGHATTGSSTVFANG